ncbi:MAG: ClpX C4-type zinc finger protein [Burkholderiales bacterium]
MDDTVIFEQRHTLNVGGKWLDRVHRLAVCRNLDDVLEFMVFHCDDDWNVLGVAAGHKSLEEAKAKVERSYRGLAAKWLPSGYTREDAAKHVAEQLKGLECSFCGRTPLQYRAVAGDTFRICNHCVDEFHEVMHEEDT